MGLLTNAQHVILGTRLKLRRSLTLFSIVCAVVCGGTAAWGQSRPLGGHRSTTIHWDKVPLRDALERLGNTLGEPIFTDRRVDPGQRISLDVTDAPSDVVLLRTADAASLGTSRLGRLSYFGPTAAARQLRTLAALGDESLAELPAKLRAKTTRKPALDWTRLTEPRQLVTKLVEDRGLKLVGAEQIPHDLWPAGSLPELSLGEQLAVLLVGFDLTFLVDAPAGAIKLVPISEPVRISRQYNRPVANVADDLERLFPGTEVHVGDGKVTVEASAEIHDQLEELLRGKQEPERPTPIITKTRKLYTLRIEGKPVGVVLAQLGGRLGWTIETDDAALAAAGKSLDEPVTFAVQNVDEDELLRALLRPAGLDYRRDGNRVHVFPQGKR